MFTFIVTHNGSDFTDSEISNWPSCTTVQCGHCKQTQSNTNRLTLYKTAIATLKKCTALRKERTNVVTTDGKESLSQKNKPDETCRNASTKFWHNLCCIGRKCSVKFMFWLQFLSDKFTMYVSMNEFLILNLEITLPKMSFVLSMKRTPFKISFSLCMGFKMHTIIMYLLSIWAFLFVPCFWTWVYTSSGLWDQVV